MIDFLVIGAQRGGTKSYYDYLLQHPFVAPALQVESGFFDRHYSKGVEWYSNQFPLLSGYPPSRRPAGHLTGECASLCLHHPIAPERVKRHCPRAKIMVLLRNPTDRAYSHYRQSVRLGKETLKFDLALKMEAKRLERGNFLMRDNPFHVSPNHQAYSYISTGMYARHLRAWLKHFPRQQVLVLRSEDFFRDPVNTVIGSYRFLGLPEYMPQLMDAPVSNAHESLTPGTRGMIDGIFRPSNQELCRLLDWDTSWPGARMNRHNREPRLMAESPILSLI